MKQEGHKDEQAFKADQWTMRLGGRRGCGRWRERSRSTRGRLPQPWKVESRAGAGLRERRPSGLHCEDDADAGAPYASPHGNGRAY
ncbi:hypothetical protein BS78_K201400 [Paspalum vaginatum]|uniref:Uncharacterized protein n=1 Tax=Paspalum vaginatum TaxID=158149 RepID=A0A9W8CF71_9POAL|nr:hypothetical protein BS78_K201400 [Paspalum vaginatum]